MLAVSASSLILCIQYVRYLNTYIALHSVTLKPPENTRYTRKLFSFPLIAHYLSAGPPLPHTPPFTGRPGHTHTYPSFLFSAPSKPVVLLAALTCYVRFALKASKLPVCSDRILTCRIKSIRSPAKVGLVVTDLITSPVVSWEGGGDTPPPPPQHRGSAVILCSTTGVVRPLCSCGDLLLSSARHCLRLVDV